MINFSTLAILLSAGYIFGSMILPCRAQTFRQDTYTKLRSLKNLLAMVLENTEEDSASGCLVKYYTDTEVRYDPF